MSRVVAGTGIADFDAVRLAVASPEDMLKWSHGEVTKPETINYRTQKPERDGLFCERIFGPVKDINPHDSKLKGVRSREAAIDKNGELVTKSIVRRERMGHINLAAPVAHIWFMRGTPSAMSLLLGITVRNIERVAYFASYIILDVETEKRDQFLADLEAETEAGRMAIKIRYEKEAEAEGADVKALAAAQSREVEELNESFNTKKAQLDSLVKGALLNETDYRNLPEEYEELATVGMGGTAIKAMLDAIDLPTLIKQLGEEVEGAKGQREKKLLKRLKVLEGMQAAGIRPNSLCLTVLPVIPPDLRPMVQLTGGRFATSDLNDLYRRVINRNNRLKKLIDLNAPEVIRRNEMRMLQEAVDALVDNSAARGGRAVNATGGRRRLKSISDMLKGKQGRFRQNLLGKRVDYSGRSVIVVGPKLKISECGLPKQMALELFKPFVISWLIRGEHAHNIRSATRLIESGDTLVWDALDAVIEGKYVLLNRAPSLHRLSIQAFQPVLVEGKAIQLHPLVANGFNADYDGDQMAVHLPLSDDAQREARELMSATNNLLKPADGAPVLNIGQDVVLGNYYLTYEKPSAQTKETKAYSSVYEAEMAYDQGVLQLQTPIRVFAKGEIRDTTLGRVFFNEILPADYPYDNSVQNKKQLKKVLAKIFNQYDAEETAKIADRMKGLAFRFATIAAVSTGKDDYLNFDEIGEFVSEGDEKTALISDQFDQGLITEDERYNLTVQSWRGVDRKVTEFLQDQLKNMDTSISVMVNSGARGDISNVKLASAMVGIMVDAANREIELPIRSSYKAGLSSLESFVATRGARKGLIDTALKTADSGYLTRRLVDVSQDVFTVEDEEGDDEGFAIRRAETEETMIDFKNRLYGRFTAEDVGSHIKKDELITMSVAEAIEADSSIDEVKIQSVLSTKNLRGIPKKSYGIDMSTGSLVANAQPVGVIAAQSVGEPGTQLTLRTFHAGGVAGGDITQGLPRVEELFEARSPKGQAFVTEVTGTVDIWEDGKKYIVQVTPEAGHVERIALEGRTINVKSGSNVKVGDVLASSEGEARPLVAPFDGVVEVAEDTLVLAANAGAPVRYEIPGNTQLVVRANDQVEAGDRLTIGSLNLHDLMRLKGTEATQRYIINEVLRIYAAQGQDVADKHLEIIVRQMFSRVQVEDPGESTFVTGDIVSKAAVVDANAELAARGQELVQYTQLLLGITKVSIWSDSWLSAASFQDTTRVLISAATSGRADRLHGLKENVIIGRKIPVGTGAIVNTPEEVITEVEVEEILDIAE
ncbi:TPA: DNA-directed RNA polymerase subunit beta' [Candidatus Saccharibacteria bacterium]|nr:MAG: RNA polymerase (beta' subunit) [Candidatus Saccharibacteria bacterium GW2011_GWC2_44_17]MBH1956220.1 DNA-directed RNA polymerase subunit beta' [Candidatus Saccharibacteria bacterium]OGL23469.1 MAG: DNA-directed RNA polymerase subunit beta' [Candidatus Saccharibacteria bacterium RIFCSPHIGHO2_01_FULL_46_30]OGL34013.1 MAG: DNA-directed RNA polymerase subunit beta' [Candidatus Saccharibacteria bacterium RIFCSPHIGHO2_12_FULL_47_16]MBH1972608.1 DNA-directed RNA polymerase subunit beta' [Candi